MKGKKFFTASDVARFCQVDLKTIHNWADKGEIEFFRTPGRHLRFHLEAVLAFLRKFGYPIPKEVGSDKPVIVIAMNTQENSKVVEELEDRLKDVFEVHTYKDPNVAFVAVGLLRPAVLVFATNAVVPSQASIKAITKLIPLKYVVYSDHPEAKAIHLEAGVDAFVETSDVVGLKGALMRLLTIEPK